MDTGRPARLREEKENEEEEYGTDETAEIGGAFVLESKACARKYDYA
jgi:hypothetical protein